MLSTQRLYDIASAHDTAVAAAMVAACLGRAAADGVRLRTPHPLTCRERARGRRPAERVPWRRMVERNGDTRWQHV